MRFKLALIGLTLVSSFALQGCYTQLAMFYPEPEVEQEEDGQFYETYSRAPRRPNLDIYAQDSGSGTGLAYGMMQNRFNPFYGYNNYNNPYSYFNGVGNDYGNGYGSGYNPYGYNYNLGGYTLFIPVTDSKELRTFNKERSRQHQTNLKTTRTRTSSSSTLQSSNSSGNSSSGSRSSGRSSSGSSSSSSGRRATRRN